MQWWGKRGAIRAVLITGALTTIATSASQDVRESQGEAPTTEQGVLLTIHMTPELAENASNLYMQVSWRTDVRVESAALRVIPESDALELQALELINRPITYGDGGRADAIGHWRRAIIPNVMPACPGTGACTVRLRVSAQPGTSTEGLAGTIYVWANASSPIGDGLCESSPTFPEGAEVSFTFEPID
jgi:hypothetical protein